MKADYPLFNVVVRQEAGQVYFEFYLNRTSKEKLQTEISKLAVHFAGKSAFWEIWQPNNIPKAARVVYGTVPAEFIQTVPDHGAPPALQKGVQYVVSAEGRKGIGRTSFIYSGK
jgi:hypothetical protein